MFQRILPSRNTLPHTRPQSVNNAAMPRTRSPLTPANKSPTSLAQKLAQIGLRNDWDFALHLPIRYEDETRITRVRDAVAGVDCQVEVEIFHTEVTFRPRRQLVVQTRDGDDVLYLR